MKVAFILSQPDKQFQRMDFPLEVSSTNVQPMFNQHSTNVQHKPQPHYSKTYTQVKKIQWSQTEMLKLDKIFPGSFKPRSLRHHLSETAPFLNL